jgi:hypothetical protein
LQAIFRDKKDGDEISDVTPLLAMKKIQERSSEDISLNIRTQISWETRRIVIVGNVSLTE